MAYEYGTKVINLIKKHEDTKSLDLGACYMMVGEISEKLMNRTNAKNMYLLARDIFKEHSNEDLLDKVMEKLSELEV